MSPKEIAALVNFLGFVTGAVLYAMLLAMVVRTPGRSSGRMREAATDRPLLATALLGLSWNIGALVLYGLRDFDLGAPSPLLAAAAFTALGFLPAVVVDSALWVRMTGERRRGARWIMIAAYGLSTIASGMHFYGALTSGAAPSAAALRALTFGFALLILALIGWTRNERGWGRAVWAVALAVFAVSALHLSDHQEVESWWIELIGHHASLPLALAILYQDYRFAFADLFLKRALVLIALIALAFGLYVTIAAPLLAESAARGGMTLRAIGVLLGLWVGTALVYPWLRRGVIWFVDTIVLRRADYDRLRSEIVALSAASEEPEKIIDDICGRLRWALTARDVRWVRTDPELINEAEFPEMGHLTAKIRIPVSDPPHYALVIGPLAGGRRLLSDDLAMLEATALALARRLDNLRVTHERCERDLREQQIGQLATEAELRALQAQLNPHFLFNALTTIGYLIQTAPDRALETLIRLTGLLRGVLRRMGGQFTTLGEEMDLIDSYLAIEQARFEERLRVICNVPAALRAVPIPPLVLQPLVENAVKHGIAPCKAGGEVDILARLDAPNALVVTILDTGAGASDADLASGRQRGVGLVNVERRLAGYYGDRASLHVSSTLGAGTTVEVRIPIEGQPVPFAVAREQSVRPPGER
jgi:signal transduction histidine kinase